LCAYASICFGEPFYPDIIDTLFDPGKNSSPVHPGSKRMPRRDNRACTAFVGHRLIANGTLADVVRAAKQALDAGALDPLLIFDDRDSRQIEVDFRGSEHQVLARLPQVEAVPEPAARGPGRPKLGVVPREVTLLPRHWDWLAQQPGGASAVLRRLVEQGLRGHGAKDRARHAMEAVDRFMLAMTGDFAGHEEASRALYRRDRESFITLTEPWPIDVRNHLQKLATVVWDETGTS
jgi:hypothetical protein